MIAVHFFAPCHRFMEMERQMQMGETVPGLLFDPSLPLPSPALEFLILHASLELKLFHNEITKLHPCKQVTIRKRKVNPPILIFGRQVGWMI
ncbi:unnamed protein product [Musa textilis]